MIESFFIRTLSLDFLIGYNSKNFDMNFLILRANILKSNEWFKKKSLTSFSLFDYSRNILDIRCDKNVILNTRCQNCRCVIVVDPVKNVHNFNGFHVTCSCLKKCALNSSTLEFVQKSYNFSPQEFPFTFHKDLILYETFFTETNNKKLDTACNYHFKQKIKSVSFADYEEGRVVNCKLSKIFNDSDLFSFANIFLIGIKLILFKIEENSNQIINLYTTKLLSVNLIDSKSNQLIDFNVSNYNFINSQKIEESLKNQSFFIELKLANLNDSFNLSEFDNELKNNSVLYISVGKTSEQSIVDQLIWKKQQNIVDTVIYCLIDLILTFSLELNSKTLYDITNSNFFQICIHNVLSWSSGRKSSFMTNMKLFPNNVLVVYNDFKLAKIFNDSLEIEGVKNDSNIEHNYPFFKLDSLKNLDEFLNLNTNTLNFNEYDLGIIGEKNLSDFENIKIITNNIIYNIDDVLKKIDLKKNKRKLKGN